MLRNDDSWNSKRNSQRKEINQTSVIVGIGWWVLIVLVAGLAFAMSGCGARSSIPVPPIPNTIPHNSILYVSTRALDGSDQENPNHTPNIWVINPDGTSKALTQLTASQAYCDEPAWSPDGTMIAFRSSGALDGTDQLNDNAAENIWVMKADGSGATALTHLTASQAGVDGPAWSPDSIQIAFAANWALSGKDLPNVNNTSNIWVVKADGSSPATPLTQLTALGADSISPAWAPASQIAFASRQALNGNGQVNTNGTLNIWVMKPDGTALAPLTKLTATGADSDGPVWSPDGKQIAFTSGRAVDRSDNANVSPARSLPTQNIWVINVNDLNSAQALAPLMSPAADSDAPVWSPDGTRIAFESGRPFGQSNDLTTTFNIWVVDADGLNAKALTQLSAADSLQPSWSPDSTQIAFASDRDLNGADQMNANTANNVWVMSENGYAPTALTSLRHTYCNFPLEQ